MKSAFIFMTVLLLAYTPGISQDWGWWNERNQWDGVTSWHYYLVISPAYMGPNALPVPQIKNGAINQGLQLESGTSAHFSRGDNTFNLYEELFIPIAKGKVGINLGIVPFEYYHMDTATRDERRSRDYDGKGSSVGDLYVATWVQLLKGHDYLPDVLLTINLKTASGNNLAGARFTDSPGYFFDVSIGKTFDISLPILQSIRAYAMTGFYVYQTNRDVHLQNDALLYGIGTTLNFNKIKASHHWGGYSGYIGNGDRPQVYRMLVETTFPTFLNAKIRFQQGLRDFEYTSIRLSTVANFGGR